MGRSGPDSATRGTSSLPLNHRPSASYRQSPRSRPISITWPSVIPYPRCLCSWIRDLLCQCPARAELPGRLPGYTGLLRDRLEERRAGTWRRPLDSSGTPEPHDRPGELPRPHCPGKAEGPAHGTPQDQAVFCDWRPFNCPSSITRHAPDRPAYIPSVGEAGWQTPLPRGSCCPPSRARPRNVFDPHFPAAEGTFGVAQFGEQASDNPHVQRPVDHPRPIEMPGRKVVDERPLLAMAHAMRRVPSGTGISVSAASVSAPSCVPAFASATSWTITASILSRSRLFADISPTSGPSASISSSGSRPELTAIRSPRTLPPW